LSQGEADGLLHTGREIASWAYGEANPTREELYKKFVIVDGTRVADGWLDRDKPFASQIKQLADLRYITSLPDALDRFPLTPADSLHRTALQEDRHLENQGVDPDELLRILLRRRAFDLVQRPLNVSLDGIGLPQLWAVRQTDEWHLYIRTLERLIKEPEAFDTRAQAVYSSYTDVARRLADAVSQRRASSSAIPGWMPTVKVVIEALGATLSIMYGDTTTAEVSGAISTVIAAESSTAVVRLVIGHRDRRHARHQLGTGIDTMRVRFEQSEKDWHTLIARLQQEGVPVRRVNDSLEDDSAIDAPHDRQDW
jgi:hypothetical protein